AQDGGPIAYLRTGDIVTVDQDTKEISMAVSDEELEKRRKNWVKPEQKIKTGYLARYAKLTTSANTGAILQ
ncbi:MAG: dihydroxy-acid dehydratase, partial [Selenomonas sp.]|nr:dihydroxy-acid dehydratase [Selenomonas sp.]